MDSLYLNESPFIASLARDACMNNGMFRDTFVSTPTRFCDIPRSTSVAGDIASTPFLFNPQIRKAIAGNLSLPLGVVGRGRVRQIVGQALREKPHLRPLVKSIGKLKSASIPVLIEMCLVTGTLQQATRISIDFVQQRGLKQQASKRNKRAGAKPVRKVNLPSLMDSGVPYMDVGVEARSGPEPSIPVSLFNPAGCPSPDSGMKLEPPVLPLPWPDVYGVPSSNAGTEGSSSDNSLAEFMASVAPESVMPAPYKTLWPLLPLATQSRGFANTTIVNKTGTKFFGKGELFGGRQDWITNRRMTDLPKQNYKAWPRDMHFTRWPGVVGERLGAEYWFRETPNCPMSVYHHQTEKNNCVFVGSADKRMTEARTIENTAKAYTTGFAVQLLFEGRGVKAVLQPSWPHLSARLTVGSPLRDLSYIAGRDPDVVGHLNKDGTILTLHGPTKKRVGHVAMCIWGATKAAVYTGKGSHLAFNTPLRKTMKKR
ncbi:hypothetical protein FOL47_002836 [Perkinsus chesapeaki]|uniref:Uncharacterized protein n=1 Tax=Perkinsus chesapeaki TaxID=330153 RepID=A0A7J6MBF8_PERCH|nr:hypothetical protein FOL47_002836 [Perkinsus chesapeaki]